MRGGVVGIWGQSGRGAAATGNPSEEAYDGESFSVTRFVSVGDGVWGGVCVCVARGRKLACDG